MVIKVKLLCNILLILQIFLSCKYNSVHQTSLNGFVIDSLFAKSRITQEIRFSKWVNKPFGEECIDSLVFFSEDSFSFENNCEVLDSTFGIWKMVNDTLILEQIGSYYTNGTNEINKMLWKAVVKRNEIILFEAYDWNYLENNFYKDPYQLDKKLNKFVRVQ